MKKIYILFFILIVFTHHLFSQNQPNRIFHNRENKFLNGINLAWNQYSYDLTNFSVPYFTKALDSMSTAGCNTMRWWLFVNGTQSPKYDNYGKVIGISQEEINSMKTALDLAMARGIGVVMCLWSFNMMDLTMSSPVLQRNEFLLTNPVYTKAFINNALNPIMQQIGLHPAVVCWEVFNEPEGMSNEFGWGEQKHVPMASIQQFVNLIAGAIHRVNPNIKVSNGAVTFKTNSNVSGNKNYYSDAELVKAGGDTLGKLDFYMAHYYPQNGATLSPFVHPASYWNLDKPVVIGEFPAIGIINGKDTMKPKDAYKYLYDNGYAGALSWTYTSQTVAGNGTLVDATPGIQNLVLNATEADKFNYTNTQPYVVNQIPSNAYVKGERQLLNYSALKTIFNDKESGTNLLFSILSITDTSLLKVTLRNDSLNIFINSGKTGVSRITVQAKDTNLYGLNVNTSFVIFVYDSTSDNKALYRKAWASSVENYHHYPEYAVDSTAKYPSSGLYAWDKGGLTRWSSQYTDKQWIIVDLDKVYTLQQIVLSWEAACASQYNILVSIDSVKWDTVYIEKNGNGKNDTIMFESKNIRFIKMDGQKRLPVGGQTWGMSLYSIEAYEEIHCNNIARPGANVSMCNGESKTFTAAAGGVKYEWSNGDKTITTTVSPAMNSTYTLTVTNSLGCTNSASVVVTITPLRMSGVKADACINGASFNLSGFPVGGTFTGNGIKGNTFVPSSANIGMNIITYKLTMCKDSATDTVNVHAKPSIDFTGLADKYYLKDTVVVLTGIPSGGAFSGKGIANGNTFNPFVAGLDTNIKISYIYSDSVYGCVDTIVKKTKVIKTSGLKDIFAGETKVSIYPNPNVGIFNISFMLNTQENVSIYLIDPLGNVIYKKENEILSGSFFKEIKPDNIINGLYFVMVRIGNYNASSRIIVVK